jgi:conjugative transfer signal peptidase TraF
MSVRTFVFVMWGATALIAGSAAAAYADGYRFNVSESVPVGLWQLENGAVHRGAFVSVCPPDTPVFREARSRDYVPPGSCPANYRPLFKPVVALAGDVVTVSPAGISVNGVHLANTAQVAKDGAGRPLPAFPAGRYVVQPGQAWLVSSFNRGSFDGRYFGSVSLRQINSLVRPVLVEAEGQ